MNAWFERAARQAVAMKPTKLILTVLAIPFYLLGLLAGMVVVAALFAVSALKLGVSDVRLKASSPEVT